MDANDILHNVRALAPSLRERGDAIEAARQLPEDIVAKLREAGCFRMAVPRTRDGPEMNSLEQHRVIFELSKANASVGWCVMIGMDSGIFHGYLEASVAEEIYPDIDMVQAGWVYPIGQAHRVTGGYEVTGHWRFGSGCTHCDVLDGGCTVFENGEPVVTPDGGFEWRIMLAPKERFEILDTWFATGLSGSGSNDYRVDKLFVPEEHSFSFAEPKRTETLWRSPDVVLRKMSAVPLGIARDAIDSVFTVLQTKTEKPSRRPYAENPRIQAAIAEVEGLYASAEAYELNTLTEQWTCLERGETLSKELRAHVWLSRTNAFQRSREIVAKLYDLVGASSVYVRESPLDRHYRDILTICQHMAAQTKELERVGALLFSPDGKSSTLML